MIWLCAALHCDICGNGVIVFAFCKEQDFVILWCLECDVFWRSPEILDRQNAVFARVTLGDLIPEIGCTFSGFRPATRVEIAARGWEKYIIEDEYET